jgi:tetratricopeptide (TPR) repeat protein
VARAIICQTCGSKIRAGRKKCPRCRAVLTAPDSKIAAAQSRKLTRAAAILAGAFALVVIVLWFMRGPATSATPVARTAPGDPLTNRRQNPAAAAAPSAAKDEGMARPFLDPSGKGATAYIAGDYATALKHYEEAIARNPQDAESLSNLGQVLVRMNRVEEALPYFQRALALVPDRWSYQFNFARGLGLLGRMNEAIAAYRRAQQLFPDDYVTTFNLALALHKSGDDAAAVEQYQKAIALQPGDASFRLALGNSLLRLQKRAEAAAAYQEYLRLSPAAPDADTVRAKIAELTGAAPASAIAPGGGL